MVKQLEVLLAVGVGHGHLLQEQRNLITFGKNCL